MRFEAVPHRSLEEVHYQADRFFKGEPFTAYAPADMGHLPELFEPSVLEYVASRDNSPPARDGHAYAPLNEHGQLIGFGLDELLDNPEAAEKHYPPQVIKVAQGIAALELAMYPDAPDRQLSWRARIDIPRSYMGTLPHIDARGKPGNYYAPDTTYTAASKNGTVGFYGSSLVPLEEHSAAVRQAMTENHSLAIVTDGQGRPLGGVVPGAAEHLQRIDSLHAVPIDRQADPSDRRLAHIFQVYSSAESAARRRAA